MADQPEAASQPTARPKLRFVRDDAFVSTYANNLQFEPGSLDLKFIFGQSERDPSDELGGEVIRQHTAVTMTWAEAKLLSYFLQLNTAFYEAANGKIAIPSPQLPPSPETVFKDLPEDATGKALKERALKLFEELR